MFSYFLVFIYLFIFVINFYRILFLRVVVVYLIFVTYCDDIVRLFYTYSITATKYVIKENDTNIRKPVGDTNAI